MNARLRNALNQSHMGLLITIGVSLLVGMQIPAYVGLMHGQIGKLAILPALLLLALLLAYDRKLMLVIIIALRSAGDIFLESTRFALGSAQIGVGGLINAFVIFIALLLIAENPKVKLNGLFSMWAPFLLVTLFGVVASPVKGDALRSWLSLLSYLMIFLSAFYFVRSKEDFIFCVKLVVWSSAFPVLYALVDIALNISRAGSDDFRVHSTFSHANIFAFYLTLIISLVFYLMKTSVIVISRWGKFWLGVYLFLLLALLILTKTRSAWIGCFFSFALYGLFFERRFLLYLLLLPVVGLLIPGVADRIADLGQGNEIVNYSKLNSFAWRVQLWQSALNWTKPADYVLGHGLQSFKEYSPIFFPLAGHVNWGAHSVYVQWLFELGLVGMASFLWLYYKAIRALWDMLQFDRLCAFLLIIVLCNYLIYAFSDNMFEYLSFNWYLWFIVGAGCAFSRLCFMERAQKQNFNE